MFKLLIFTVDENEYSNRQNQRLRVICQSYKLRVAQQTFFLYFVCRHYAMPMWDFKLQIHSELANYQRPHIAATYSGSTEENRVSTGQFLVFLLFIGGVLTKSTDNPGTMSLASRQPLRCTAVPTLKPHIPKRNQCHLMVSAEFPAFPQKIYHPLLKSKYTQRSSKLQLLTKNLKLRYSSSHNKGHSLPQQCCLPTQLTFPFYPTRGNEQQVHPSCPYRMINGFALLQLPSY